MRHALIVIVAVLGITACAEPDDNDCYEIDVDSCEEIMCPGGTAPIGCNADNLEALCCPVSTGH